MNELRTICFSRAVAQTFHGEWKLLTHATARKEAENVALLVSPTRSETKRLTTRMRK